MAKLKIITWIGSDGQRRKADAYTVFVFRGRRRFKVPGFRVNSDGKRLSGQLGELVEKLLDHKRQGTLPPDLRHDVEVLPVSIRESLANQDIIEAAAEGRTLALHVADFKAALEAKGNTPDHVATTTGDVLEAAKVCGFKMLGNVTPAALRGYLAQRREPRPRRDSHGNPIKDAEGKPIMRPGISARRHNAILGAWGAFFRWCIRERKISENLIIGMSKLNERTDKRHERRALGAVEARALLAAAEGGAELFGMSGAERALIYRMALETGLRQNELRTLTRGCIDLDGLLVKGKKLKRVKVAGERGSAYTITSGHLPVIVAAKPAAKPAPRKIGQRGQFAQTAEEMILSLLKGRKALTTRELAVA